MTLEEKNQNDILDEFNDPNDIEFIFNDKPINRFKTFLKFFSVSSF